MTSRLAPLLAPLLALLLCLPGLAHALELNFREVAPNIYAQVGDIGMRSVENEGMNANSGFIVTPAGVVVVDSGATVQVAEKIHAAIQKVTDQPVKIVVNTGGQDHRWLGNGYFRTLGAEIIAAAPAIADMTARGPEQLAGLKQLLGDKAAGTEIVLPSRTFSRELAFRPGGMEIRLLYLGGGHTPGDSVVWLPDSGVMFTGDLVYLDRMIGVLPVSNATAWQASFRAMEALSPRVIVPGHGPISNLAQARRDTGAYLDLLIGHMGRAVENLVDLQAAIDSLDQGAFAHLAHYELLKGGNASRVYLEMEAR